MKTAVFVMFLLAGCASIKGVEISEDERKMCEAGGGCTVWTNDELARLARKFFLQGYSAGAKSI